MTDLRHSSFIVMLTVDPFKILKVLAIDPGLHNIGLSVYEVEVSPCKFLSISAKTLRSSKVVDSSCLDEDGFSEQVRIRYSMLNAYEEELRSIRPDFVVSESPFFDRNKPSSFAVLSSIVEELFSRTIRLNPIVQFSLLAPQLVKSSLGVAGIKGKDVVREAMEKNTEIMNALMSPIETLDEHAIDATAVGYAWFKKKSGLFPKEKV